MTTVLPAGSSTFCMLPGRRCSHHSFGTAGVHQQHGGNSRRDGENANAAVLVTPAAGGLSGQAHPLGGMYWQRSIEQCAQLPVAAAAAITTRHSGGRLSRRARQHRPRASVAPSYRPRRRLGRAARVLPPHHRRAGAGHPRAGQKLSGFDSPDAVLTAPDALLLPVRILRGEDQSAVAAALSLRRGARATRGINSAAVDGMLCRGRAGISIDVYWQ